MNVPSTRDRVHGLALAFLFALLPRRTSTTTCSLSLSLLLASHSSHLLHPWTCPPSLHPPSPRPMRGDPNVVNVTTLLLPSPHCCECHNCDCPSSCGCEHHNYVCRRVQDRWRRSNRPFPSRIEARACASLAFERAPPWMPSRIRRVPSTCWKKTTSSKSSKRKVRGKHRNRGRHTGGNERGTCLTRFLRTRCAPLPLRGGESAICVSLLLGFS